MLRGNVVPRDSVKKRDTRRGNTEKHGKFDNLCLDPFVNVTAKGINDFLLKNLDVI